MPSQSSFPALHILEPSGDTAHTHTIIFLHGRGSNGPDFAEELFESQSSKGQNLSQLFPSWKWVFPTAKTRHSTVFQEDMTEWFDIYSLTDPAEQHELQKEGLAESITYTCTVMQQEMAIIGPDRLVLAGISQGCATAIHALFYGNIRLRAFIGFCGWLPFAREFSVACQSNNSSSNSSFYASQFGLQPLAQGVEEHRLDNNAHLTPVLISHARDDDVVDFTLGRALASCLESKGMMVAFKEFGDCGHWIKEPESVDDMVSFLEEKSVS